MLKTLKLRYLTLFSSGLPLLSLADCMPVAAEDLANVVVDGLPPAQKNLVMDPWPSLRGPSSKSEAATARRVQGMASGHLWNSFMTVSQMTRAVGPALRNLGMGQDLLRSPLPQPPPPPPLQQIPWDLCIFVSYTLVFHASSHQ